MHVDTAMLLAPTLEPQTNNAPGLPDGSQDADVAFEALFVSEIFKAMRSTVHESDTNWGQAVFTSMLDEKLAQNIAESGGLGLTSALHNESPARDGGRASTHSGMPAARSFVQSR